MEKLKELFTAFSGGLVAVVFLVYALAMYCIAGIAVSDITGWDWLGFIAAPIFIFLRMTFLPAGLAAWALYDVYHFNPFLAILIALPGLAWMLIGGAGLAIAGLLERLKKNNRIDHHNQIYVDTSSEKEAFNDNCSNAEMKSNDEVQTKEP